MLLRALSPVSRQTTVAFGKGQWAYVFQGGGNRPCRVDLTSAKITDMGVPAPTAAPVIATSGTPKYYIARIDVVEGGTLYNAPPAVTLVPVGAVEKPAKVTASLSGSSLGEIDVTDFGRGYTAAPQVAISDTHGKGAAVTVNLSPIPIGGTQATAQTPDNKYFYNIASVTVANAGSGYTLPPQLSLSYDEGGGGEIEVKLKPDGTIDPTAILKSAGSYTSAPKVTVSGGGAKATAIIRPHLVGRYDCYYRYVDDTPEDRGGPLPSNLSPVTTINTGDGVGLLTWTVPAPPVSATGRTLKVELWRTTSDQAYTLYRIKTFGGGTFLDDLSDVELVDFDRADYAALPVVLPNGELNANRFGLPPSDKSVAVMFQDRLWMAVDTGGDEPNVLRFSEYDEPESCPDINELVLQTNTKGHDHITALIPYGGSLGVMQTRHAHRLSYVSQPTIDANVQIAAYRGCLNQRCWDEYQGLIYCMDTEGVYAMDQAGSVTPISQGLHSLFRSGIDFAAAEWFSVVADRGAKCLRVSVRLKTDTPGEYPTRQYCYSFDLQGWWEERYPAPMVGGANMRDATGVDRCVYGTSNKTIVALNQSDLDYADGSVQGATLTVAGSGYEKTPKVTVTGGGSGAVVEAAVGTDGSLIGLYVRCGGYGYTNARIIIDSPTGAGGLLARGTLITSSAASKIPCWFKTGNMEYPTDTLPVEMKDQTRNVSVLFTPTQGTTPLKLRMYYNNSPVPRINVAARDRGTGAIYDTQEPAVTLDMDASLLPERVSSGVCRALFSSHTVDDIRGNDRHVAVELYATRGTTGDVVIHSVDVYGVPGAQ